MATLILPGALLDRLMAEARAAAPAECCGLLEGAIGPEGIEVLAVHPVANLAVRQDRFEIDPGAHLALQRALRGSPRLVVGCYHSHPGGQAIPSPRDRETISPEGFVWVIIATGVNDALAAFVGPSFQPLLIRRDP